MGKQRALILDIWSNPSLCSVIWNSCV